ncbi:hypothetical protein [Pedobacter sp. ASV28]|uniref:hypothetical protein n=1 Tax=Pedobacter sp. ASV28 TaxID=2795123 RepID=UPI0018EDA44D|nr:hypothetical protein [Pedobacter sp. ASV28]
MYFPKDYEPMTLTALETYIKVKGHLPEVPSEKEVAQNGIELGEMNKILLKKIEELTLYLIKKEKRMENLERRLQKLEKINSNK